MTLSLRSAGPLTAALLLTGGCGIADPTPHPVVQEEPESRPEVKIGQPAALAGELSGLAAAGYRSALLVRQPVPEGWTMEQTALDSLVRIGQPAVPALVKLLDRPEAKIRGEAAAALARIGPEARSAVAKLVALVENDPDPAVRRFAVRALGQIGPRLSAGRRRAGRATAGRRR